MAGSERAELKFLDEASLSYYACDTCHALPKCSLKAQCCGAIYCKQCAEVAETNAVIAAEQRKGPLVNVRTNLRAIVCVRCKKGDLRLLLDEKMQETIDRLQVQCLQPGCGWVGEFSSSEAHLKEPHDKPEEIYDNDVPAQDLYEDTLVEPEGAEEVLYEDTEAQEIYDVPAQDLYEDTLVEPEGAEEVLYEDTEAQHGEEIYDNDTQDRPEELYEDMAPLHDGTAAEKYELSGDLEEMEIYENDAPYRPGMSEAL